MASEQSSRPSSSSLVVPLFTFSFPFSPFFPPVTFFLYPLFLIIYFGHSLRLEFKSGSTRQSPVESDRNTSYLRQLTSISEEGTTKNE